MKLWNHPLVRAVAWPALMALLLSLLIGSLLWNALAALLYPLLPRARGLVVGRAAISRGYGLFWLMTGATRMLQLHAQSLDVLREERGLIVVANHPSMLDAVMLVARLPRAACIMKANLVNNPLLGAAVRLARYIRNDATFSMVKRAVEDLQAGGQLVLFPEGTRTTRWPLNPCHSAMSLIASRAGVPIQTVIIDTDSPYLGKGWPAWRLPRLPAVFTVRLGRRFAPSEDPAAQQREIEAYLASEVHLSPFKPVAVP
ncbi:MAG: lysophospholipid acyltransferase family protein [Rubrivivax sp.]